MKVLSDKIDDVTTVENIVKSFVKPGMSDQERRRRCWRAVVKYRHQTTPPNEHLAGDWEAHDPVKIMNVYGYCMCCCCSALIEALNREDGREARGRILNAHSVPEVRYGGGWHMYDGSLITYFPRPDDGVVASVDDIAASIAEWYARHPGFQKNGEKIFQLMRKDGWSGWKAVGPALLAKCPFYRMGYLPARTHGWDATMTEYDRKSEVYEYGYQVGHRALFSLRPGESFVREAGNRGLHVNMDVDPAWDGLKAKAPQNDLVYVNEFMPGYRGGVAANGTHRYEPDLAAGDLELGAEVFENLSPSGALNGLAQFREGEAPSEPIREAARTEARPPKVTKGRSALKIKTPGRPGIVIVPMISPYVYLGGKLHVKARGQSSGDRLTLSISTNNARSFATIYSSELTGPTDVRLELGPSILRRYGYWIKIELAGSMELDTFKVSNDFQHAPRTLPWLGKGKNTIAVAADADPAIATRSITCRITPDPSFTKNETSTTMGLLFDNVDLRYDACWWKGGTGVMTAPIEVPGDLAALSFSVQYRARSEKDRIKVSISTDDGRTWRERHGSGRSDTGSHRAHPRRQMASDGAQGTPAL